MWPRRRSSSKQAFSSLTSIVCNCEPGYAPSAGAALLASKHVHALAHILFRLRAGQRQRWVSSSPWRIITLH